MNTIRSISQFHKLVSLPEPLHPLVSVIDLAKITYTQSEIWKGFVNRFYCVALKHDVKGKLKYGHQYYDYDKGILSFTAPNQVQYLDLQNIECGNGWLLIFHPDFLLRHNLANAIHQYGFFSYTVNEALHLSAEEEQDLLMVLHNIERECKHIDKHTQEIIISQIELLLNYPQRFYERQFITRKNNNHHLLEKFEQLLNDHYNSPAEKPQGLLTVQNIAGLMNISPNYLSDL
ncbi:MAG: AraC family transcriptional regulator, partial [Pedobacter sp.]